jgi:Family of unknown function (DUF5343)
MAKKNTAESEKPKFPYTNLPGALRKILKEIPKRPRPSKMALETLGSWGISNDNNARTAINVLKRISLLSSDGAPMPDYVEYMKAGSGPRVLAKRIRETYKDIFENSHSPQTETDEALRSLFNIHSGGGEDSMRLQIQTFKALCEHADWSETSAAAKSSGETSELATANERNANRLPPVQIDLHIHLPENKTTRDYEAIIQDIAKYIYGRSETNRG